MTEAVVEPETIEGDAVEVTETDEQPTLAEYEAAKETIRALLAARPEGAEADEAAGAEEAAAYEVIERAERLGIRASRTEADVVGVTTSMLPALREAVETQEIERAHPLPAAHALPTKLEWEAAMAVAREISMTQFVPKEIRGKPDQVLACILTGRELGIGPMEALRKIHMIDGRPAFAAELMLSLMRKGGVTLLESEATMERGFIKAKRSDTGEIASVEFTWVEAQLIDNGKLVSKSNWKNYRQDMLWARTVSRLGRRLAPDLLGGMSYSAEEVQDFDDGGSDYSSTTVNDGPPAANVAGSVTFRPGHDLLDKAPRNFEDTAKLLGAIDGAMDWQVWGSEARAALFGEADFAKLSDEQRAEFGRRMANTATYLQDEVMEARDFPPPSHDEIRKAFAWGFEGAALLGPPVAEGEETPEAKMEPETTPEIDPGKDLLKNAIKGKDQKATKELNSRMEALSDEVDWPALIAFSCAAQYKVQGRGELTAGQRGEWWLRLCNAIANVQTTDIEASPDQIAASFKWAFPEWDGTVPLLAAEAQTGLLSGAEMDAAAARAAAEGENIGFGTDPPDA